MWYEAVALPTIGNCALFPLEIVLTKCLSSVEFAVSKAVGAYVEENSKAFKYQIDPDDGTPYKKKYDPRAWLRAGEVSMVERLDEAFQDLGSVGKTLAS